VPVKKQAKEERYAKNKLQTSRKHSYMLFVPADFRNFEGHNHETSLSEWDAVSVPLLWNVCQRQCRPPSQTRSIDPPGP